MPSLLDHFRPKTLALVAAYVVILVASFWVAYEARFDFEVPAEFASERLRLLWPAVAIKFLGLVLLRQTGTMLRYFSIPDLFRVAAAMAIASAILIVPRFLGQVDYIFPRGVLLIDLLLSITALTAFRVILRVYQERVSGVGGQTLEKIFIVGAGDTGAALAREFLAKPKRGFKPVAFLDDDRSKKGRLIHGLRVMGRPEEVPDAKYGAVQHVVLAMPSASQRRHRELSVFYVQKGFKVETVPAIEDLAAGRVKVSQIRPVEVEDLLGREAIDQDTEAVRGFVAGKVVMVTGAGGSIGSELCRQIAGFNPKRLLLVEQSEPALFLIEQEMNERGMGAICSPVVADILDSDRMNDVFGRFSPQVVFHAAAHKHVYLMERQPGEAIRNNTVGTRQLAKIAIEHRAEAFVLISTDKAVNPTNVMGASKRLAELHLQALHARQQAGKWSKEQGAGMESGNSGDGGRSTEDGGQKTEGRGQKTEVRGHSVVGCSVSAEKKPPLISAQPKSTVSTESKLTKLMAVRFGNVLGSSGSVVPIFRKQIAAGGPVTVTHPEVTRYFMTIPEAVGLVMQAAVMGKGGDIFVLDMGKPVKIVDLARQMIELSGFKVGDDVEIVFSGLKPGEKLFEELQHHDEQHLPTEHPRVMRFVSDSDPAAASAKAIDQLEPMIYTASPNRIKEQLREIVPEYTPYLD